MCGHPPLRVSHHPACRNNHRGSAVRHRLLEAADLPESRSGLRSLGQDLGTHHHGQPRPLGSRLRGYASLRASRPRRASTTRNAWEKPAVSLRCIAAALREAARRLNDRHDLDSTGCRRFRQESLIVALVCHPSGRRHRQMGCLRSGRWTRRGVCEYLRRVRLSCGPPTFALATGSTASARPHWRWNDHFTSR